MSQTPSPQTLSRLRVRIDDEERLAALHSYRIMDTAEEPNYERLVDLLHGGCKLKWTSVTFVDRERQWFKAVRGYEYKESPRAFGFCSVSMQQLAPLIVENALLDPRFRDNPVVVEKGLRFFAGYPLFSSDGYGLGSVCVLDTKPHSLLNSQLDLLEKARNWVQADLERRRAALTSNMGANCLDTNQRQAAAQQQALKKLMAERLWDAFTSAATPALAHACAR